MNAALPLLLLGLLLAAPAGAQPAVPAQSAQVAGFEDMKAARTALDELIRAYETGDVGLIQSRLDPGMIGYQRFIDGLRRDTTALKQIRLHLFEANVTAGPDVTMIEAAWEKRFFGVADFTPGLFRGRSTFLMHRAKEGWRLAAVSGDNPFSSEAGALATLSVMPAALPLGSLAPCPGAAVPLAIELVDPDLAGRQHEAVAVVPVGIARVALEPARPQHVGHRRGAERQAGMTAVGLLHHVHRKETQRVDGEAIECVRHVNPPLLLNRQWPRRRSSALRPAGLAGEWCP